MRKIIIIAILIAIAGGVGYLVNEKRIQKKAEEAQIQLENNLIEENLNARKKHKF